MKVLKEAQLVAWFMCLFVLLFTLYDTFTAEAGDVGSDATDMTRSAAPRLSLGSWEAVRSRGDGTGALGGQHLNVPFFSSQTCPEAGIDFERAATVLASVARSDPWDFFVTG